MIFRKEQNLFFLESIYFLLKKDICLYINHKQFLFSLHTRLFSLDNLELLTSVSFNTVTNKYDISHNLDNYIDDLDKFDFHNRKYKWLLKKELTNKKSRFKNKKNIIAKSKKLSWSIYDSGSGLLKIIKSWNYYLNGRYGVGSGILSLFSKYNGTLNKNHLSMNFFNIYIYKISFCSFFLRNIEYFDYYKIKLDTYSYLKHKKRFTFKGWCFLNRYPVNGQKRRTNYKTTRNYNQFIILKK